MKDRDVCGNTTKIQHDSSKGRGDLQDRGGG